MDPCAGDPAVFFNELKKYEVLGLSYCEIQKEIDFYQADLKSDWLIGNPPYSDLSNWLDKSADLATHGIAYLIGWLNVSPLRLSKLAAKGFHLREMLMLNVPPWPGYSVFCIWTKGSFKPTRFRLVAQKYYYDQDEIDRYHLVTKQLKKGTHSWGEAEKKPIKEPYCDNRFAISLNQENGIRKRSASSSSKNEDQKGKKAKRRICPATKTEDFGGDSKALEA